VGSLDFYLDAIKAAVDEVKARYPKRKIHLVVSQ
jgi:alpha-beta hydrolase superfamily lysophospholipase